MALTEYGMDQYVTEDVTADQADLFKPKMLRSIVHAFTKLDDTPTSRDTETELVTSLQTTGACSYDGVLYTWDQQMSRARNDAMNADMLSVQVIANTPEAA